MFRKTIAVFLLSTCAQLTIRVEAAQTPNLVYLMADDLGWVDIAASAANMLSYEIPDQTGLKPIKKK